MVINEFQSTDLNRVVQKYVYRPFPKMVFRGTDEKVVRDDAELAACQAQGWKTREQLAAIETVGEPEPKPEAPVLKGRGRKPKERA